jgi:rRNA maturation protein Nop10
MTRYKCPACGKSQYSADPHRDGDICIYCGQRGVESMPGLDPAEDEKKEDVRK